MVWMLPVSNRSNDSLRRIPCGNPGKVECGGDGRRADRAAASVGNSVTKRSRNIESAASPGGLVQC